MTAPRLTEREVEVVRRAAHGWTDQQIADDLGLSVQTILDAWRRIRARLGTHSRTHVVAMAVAARVVNFDAPAITVTPSASAARRRVTADQLAELEQQAAALRRRAQDAARRLEGLAHQVPATMLPHRRAIQAIASSLASMEQEPAA